MTRQEEWAEIIARIRAEQDPLRSLHLRRLYEVAVSDAPRFLSSFRRALDEERMLDLTHDLLAEKLEAILDADAPRAFFCTALKRRAISWLRRGDAAVAEAPPSSSRPAEQGTPEEDRHGFLHDARGALEAMSERDRGIVVAVGLGEDREAIARELELSRVNIDQIVSRARKRFREGDS